MLPRLGFSVHPSHSWIHLLDNIVIWIAFLIGCICQLEVAKVSFAEHCPLYLVSTLLSGLMLDVATHGPYGGKLCLLSQGWYVWSTWTIQNRRFDRDYIGISNANSTTWLDFHCLCHVGSRGCLGKNIIWCLFSRRMSFSFILQLVLATGLDRHFGSGYGSEPNRSQIGGPGRQ